MLAGAMIGVIFAVLAVGLRKDQIIVGTALTMLGLGVTGTLFRARDAGLTALVDTDAVVRVPLLSGIPVIGGALFAQPLITYIAVCLVPVTWWVLYRTHIGVTLRAVGESPDAARAAGVRVRITQACAVIVGSALGGLAGGALVLAQAGTFAEGMSAGRGFLAIAIVALGRWRPAGVALAAVVFGAAMALQFVVQALGWTLRYELVLMIPYALTLAALGAFGKGSAPAMLGGGRAAERDSLSTTARASSASAMLLVPRARTPGRSSARCCRAKGATRPPGRHGRLRAPRTAPLRLHCPPSASARPSNTPPRSYRVRP